MLKFGFKGPTTIIITTIYIAVTGSMFIVSMFYVSTVNWGTEVSAFNNVIDINEPAYGF